MEFGIFNSASVFTSKVAELGDAAEHHSILNEIEYIKAADRAGFKYTWATEHHFLEEYSHLSANESFLAYAAAVTKNIHLGSGIMNITPPVNHPVRVAERVAMIDHLSGGRFEFGMGRGSSTTEQIGFGIPDPDITKEMFDEVCVQFKHMWRKTSYEFEGRFFSVPARNVLPKPYTTPHPPMWVAAGNTSTFEKAGKMGIGVLCFSILGPEMVGKFIEIYKKAVEKADPVGEYINNNVMVTTQMLCLEDGERARNIACDMSSGRHHSLLYRYLDTFPRSEHVPLWPEVLPEPTREVIDYSINAGFMAVGNPEDCRKVVQMYVDAGADQLAFGQLSTTMPIEVCIEAVETFGKYVIPEFDRDPVHSTTRQREAQMSALV